jgi:hypothetical protein
MGVWHSSVLLNLGEGLGMSLAQTHPERTHKIPSLLLDKAEVALVDNTPDSKTFTLQTSVTAAKGEIPNEPLGAVKSRLDNRLDEVGKDTGHVVVWL